MVPALYDLAAGYDTAGAALKAAFVVECQLAVLIFVELGRAGEDDFTVLFLIFKIAVDLDVGITLIGMENIIAQFVIYRYSFSHYLIPPSGLL